MNAFQQSILEGGKQDEHHQKVREPLSCSYKISPGDLLDSQCASVWESSKHAVEKKLSILFVMDFECNQPHNEIIEFPIVTVDLHKQRIIDTFHSFIQPTLCPRLNPYVSRLTGITSRHLNSAPTFSQVFPNILKYLENHVKNAGGAENCAVVYDCDRDCQYLRDQLVNQNISKVPEILLSFVNLRRIFPLRFSGGEPNRSLAHALESLDMQFVGKQHSGLDDAKNIARVAMKLSEKGFDFTNKLRDPQFIKVYFGTPLNGLQEYNKNFLFVKIMRETETQYLLFQAFLGKKKVEDEQVLVKVEGPQFQFTFKGSAFDATQRFMKPTREDIIEGEVFNEQLSSYLERAEFRYKTSAIVLYGNIRQEFARVSKFTANKDLFNLKNKTIFHTNYLAELYASEKQKQSIMPFKRSLTQNKSDIQEYNQDCQEYLSDSFQIELFNYVLSNPEILKSLQRNRYEI